MPSTLLTYHTQAAAFWKRLRRPLGDYTVLAYVCFCLFDRTFLSGLPPFLYGFLFFLASIYCAHIITRR